MYRFMRKILEKYNWNLDLAGEMLREYHKNPSKSRQKSGKICVYVSLILKNTGNWQIIIIHTKGVDSEKNVEKLQNLIRQREIWENFAEECFRDYPQ